MPRPMKVWGGMTFVGGQQVRAVVAATTKKRAVEVINEGGSYTTMNDFNGYWSETGNRNA